jgi:hypothetical protein
MGQAIDVTVTRQSEEIKFLYGRDLAGQRSLDSPLGALNSERERISFVLLRDAVNFGSGYHPWLAKDAGMSGARTIGARLLAAVRRDGLPSAEALSEITAAQCAELLGQPTDGRPGELMGMFAAAWNGLGRALAERYDGDYLGLVEEAAGSAVVLAGLLASVPYWNDISVYDGIEVPFMKRAQLAALGVHRARKLSDLSELTIFADNLIPHVLRLDGLLAFSAGLEARIEAGELLPHDSAPEVEIRAGAVHVCELIAAAAARDGAPVAPVELASALWSRGQQPRYKARPRHRTLTYAY